MDMAENTTGTNSGTAPKGNKYNQNLPPPKYPLQGYNFKVFIQRFPLDFAKISGLERSIETEPLQEGGINEYVRSLYKPYSSERVMTFERGLISLVNVNYLAQFLAARFAVGQRLTMPITIVMYDPSGKIGKMYSVHGATVRKWSTSGLDASSGNVVIESFEIVYESLEEDVGMAMAVNLFL